ncbi:MAG: Rv1355c family protein, partial [Bacteroidia bacterium]
MKEKLNDLVQRTLETSLSAEPQFFRLTNAADRIKIEQLLKDNPSLVVYDEILGQVEEYVKSKNPKIVYKKEELTKAAKNHIGKTPHIEYGTWVFYPWANRLVHLLDKEEFVEVRTNRNQYKITPEEKTILSQKK